MCVFLFIGCTSSRNSSQPAGPNGLGDHRKVGAGGATTRLNRILVMEWPRKRPLTHISRNLGSVVGKSPVERERVHVCVCVHVCMTTSPNQHDLPSHASRLSNSNNNLLTNERTNELPIQMAPVGGTGNSRSTTQPWPTKRNGQDEHLNSFR